MKGLARPKGVLYAWQRAIRNDDSLTTTQKFVALMLSTWMDARGAGAYASTTKIAARCGYADRRPVRKALGALRSAGYLSTEERTGRTSIYTATFPDLGLLEYQVDADLGLQEPAGGALGVPGGGAPEDPLSVPLSAHLSGAPEPATETPARALEQLRKLVEQRKTLDAFPLPEEARQAAVERFRDESDRLLRLCAEQPSFEGVRL